MICNMMSPKYVTSNIGCLRKLTFAVEKHPQSWNFASRRCMMKCAMWRMQMFFFDSPKNLWEPGSHEFERSTCAENGHEFRRFFLNWSPDLEPKIWCLTLGDLWRSPERMRLLMRRCMSPTPCWRSLFELWCWRWTCCTKRGYRCYKRQGVFGWQRFGMFQRNLLGQGEMCCKLATDKLRFIPMTWWFHLLTWKSMIFGAEMAGSKDLMNILGVWRFHKKMEVCWGRHTWV